MVRWGRLRAAGVRFSPWRLLQEFAGILGRRDEPRREPLTLNRRRIFILPSRHGLIFATVLLAMMIAAINYANSLAYLLTFLLSAIGMVAMLHTFRNLNRITLQPGRVPPCFAGEMARFPLILSNGDTLARRALTIETPVEQIRGLDLAPEGELEVTIALPAPRRGRLQMPRLSLRSAFPLGFFGAWSPFYFAAEAIVYPQPGAMIPFPEAGGAGDEQEMATVAGREEFSALRSYRPGDSLRHVHWKAYARGGALMVKEYQGEGGRRLWFVWENCPVAGIEERLSLLCRWVVEAEKRGLEYGLKLPGVEIPPLRGEDHFHRVLKRLALYG
ncbi:MAG: DUF58 domain-containing protein [Gammaproteobacteria bacterium]|nr:DUF58 domain-containing protein [Gammaproteobacteria bacterium]